MKKFLRHFLVSALTASTFLSLSGSNQVFAAGWINEDLSVAYSFNAVRFPSGSSEQRAVAVGGINSGGGVIFKTSNRGDSWVRKNIDATQPVWHDVDYMVSGAELLFWVAGENGEIRKSSDSGETWGSSPMSGAGRIYYGIDLVNSTVGYAVGKNSSGTGAIDYTSSGGSIWYGRASTLPAGTGALYDVKCLNTSTCYTVGASGKILKTTDRALTGSWSTETSGVTSVLRAIARAGSGWVVVGDDGVIRKKTSDSATVWTRPNTTTFAYDFTDVVFLNETTGFITTSSGDILLTQDGGVTWAFQLLGANALHGIDLQTGASTAMTVKALAVGASGQLKRYEPTPPTGTISINGGATYTTSTAVSVAMTCTNPGDDGGCSYMKFAADGAIDTETYRSLATPQAATLPSGDGAKTVAVKFKDNGIESSVFTDSIVLDTVAPSSVGIITLTTPDSDNTPTLTWTGATDASGVEGYDLRIDTNPYTNIGNVTSYTFTDALVNGAHSVSVRSRDLAGNVGSPSSLTFTIAVPTTDTTNPTAPTNLTRISVDTDTTPTFSWTASTDNVGVIDYRVEIQDSMEATVVPGSNLGNVLTYTVPDGLALTPGTHRFFVRASDAAGNTSVPDATLDFTISAAPAPSGDTTVPSAPANLRNTSAATDTSPDLAWNAATDNVGVAGYELQLDGASFIGLGNALTYTVNVAVGAHTVNVRAYDAAGNRSVNASLALTVTSTAATPTPSPGALTLPAGVSYGDLVKLSNDGDPTTFGDTAVFYVGANGKRYVFPNDKTYFVWYADFSTVKTVSMETMAAIPLAGNVNYRPGVRMVKLQTNNDVYVVSRGGILHKVPSEDVARALYGESWNRQIDDVSDAFWFSYRADAALTSATDFNVASETAAALSISWDKSL